MKLLVVVAAETIGEVGVPDSFLSEVEVSVLYPFYLYLLLVYPKQKESRSAS